MSARPKHASTDQFTPRVRAEPNSYGGGNPGAYGIIAVLQGAMALPLYLCPHEVRSALCSSTHACATFQRCMQFLFKSSARML